MQLKIRKFPEPILRKKAKAVKKVTPEILRLIESMIETLYPAKGVGLAAPQVGKSLRVIVIDVGQEPMALINPEIIEKSGEQCFMEGCLSLPGIEGPVVRAAKIKIKGLNCEGEKIEEVVEGFLATVIQHEIDHLEGKVFIDRVQDPTRIKYISKSKEKKEELI